ncbi:YdeI/OmpD-associated family protein [Catenovulum sp. 2E275]|uniref:YdeI/OmpD-associated family protein n=1 Tax=Catenovulum sp. 2E275 TaxID=2980497 RepID=UPI0021CF44FE|nr:YdeI/OmpD-associated family protein [Catenovulum sp. 2E275]MCU4674114.1 YdeI/OmpD-associated family protein [Catenovulum sp. 2E275]
MAKSIFEAELLCPAKQDKQSPWYFVILPKAVSDTLSRRGRVTIKLLINQSQFQTLAEPDGQLSHWFKLSAELCSKLEMKTGEILQIELVQLDEEPEPVIPEDFWQALSQDNEAKLVWDSTTTIAKLDWIHWVESAKQTKTRLSRIDKACDMLNQGKKRVCCFDSSGFYSKSLSAPKAV